MRKIKFDKTALERFVAERTVLDGQIGDYEVKNNELFEIVEGLETEIRTLQTTNSAMKYGDLKMDATAYLMNENRVMELTDQLNAAKKNYSTFNRLGDSLKEDVYTPLLADADDVMEEFYDNTLMVQKEIFSHLKDIEKLCVELENLSKEYTEEFKYIPHSKAKYKTFGVMDKMSRIWSRFGVVCNGRVRYNQTVTADLYDFEK